MSIYEVLGMGYVIASTTFFTAQVIYFVAKGVSYMHRLVQRAQKKETLDLQRSLSIKPEMAKLDYPGMSGTLPCDRRSISRWKQRFESDGLSGLFSKGAAPYSGKRWRRS